MIPAVYERKKAGIYLDGDLVFERWRTNGAVAIPVLGTPWTLSHEERMMSTSESIIKIADVLRLSNLELGTDVIQIDVGATLFAFRFYSLNLPNLRSDGMRLRLYERNDLVAEHSVAWRDRDVARGILSRVETRLNRPAADAAAILLFQLVDRPLAALSGVEPAPQRPLGF